MIAGWQMGEKLPAMVDACLRVVHDDEAPGQWPFVLEAGPDADYITGDRLGVMPDRFPMNIREVMLAAGYDIPRPEALAWMETLTGDAAMFTLQLLDERGAKYINENLGWLKSQAELIDII